MLEKKYNSREAEEKWKGFWSKEDIYKFNREDKREIYSIDTPPPTISGSLHMGHIFSYTQAEIIARFQRMQGKNVFYPFGFDDNGLPTERLVEREEGILARDIERSEFIRSCLNTTDKYVGEFKKLWEALGFSVDWSLQYETISPLAQKISQSSFIKLAKDHKAYVKESPVLWCTNCQTSIAQAELDNAEKETSFIWIPFSVENEELLVATTRPELLYSCRALFIHPEDNRFNRFIGKEAFVPLYNFNIPIMADSHVNREKGSGIVMCATFGDTLDLEWFNTHNFSYKKTITSEGKIVKGVPFIEGQSIKEARGIILERLKEQGLIRKIENIKHGVAVHERCGNEIEIIPSRQWYIDILSNKARFLEAGEEINWYPASMKIRYKNWVENLKWDWCISRQRYFGVPIPVWYCRECGNVVFAKEEDLPVNPLETSPREACNCGCKTYIPEEAVLDTWATSSLSPLINSKYGEKEDISDKLLPMSMRTQAHEIIRTWAFYTIVKSLYHTNKLPWKDIMICGFVMAKKGEKISKSKNNSVSSPKELLNKYSADAIRYWAASSKLGTDTMFSEEELLSSNRFLTKLWNSARFCLMHLQDYKGETPHKLLSIDRWVLERLKETMYRAEKYLQKYEIGSARQEIDEFFWKDFCDNYLEIVKDRLYKPEIHGEENRKSAQYALYCTLLGIIKLYAPYVPYITEEIYQSFFKAFEKEKSIHLLLWSIGEGFDEGVLSFGRNIVSLITDVRKHKSDRNLSLKEPIENISIKILPENKILLMDIIKDLAACTSAEKIEIFEGDSFIIKIK